MLLLSTPTPDFFFSPPKSASAGFSCALNSLFPPVSTLLIFSKIKIDFRDLENENVKVHFDGGPSGDEPRPVVYKRSPDPSRFLQLGDELVEDASKEPPKLAPNKKYIGELDFEEINKAQRESRKKRMPQPGKNLCPRDQSMQTIASWFQERPEKVRKLRAQLAEEKPFFAAIPKKC